MLPFWCCLSSTSQSFRSSHTTADGSLDGTWVVPRREADKMQMKPQLMVSAGDITATSSGGVRCVSRWPAGWADRRPRVAPGPGGPAVRVGGSRDRGVTRPPHGPTDIEPSPAGELTDGRPRIIHRRAVCLPDRTGLFGKPRARVVDRAARIDPRSRRGRVVVANGEGRWVKWVMDGKGLAD